MHVSEPPHTPVCCVLLSRYMLEIAFVRLDTDFVPSTRCTGNVWLQHSMTAICSGGVGSKLRYNNRTVQQRCGDLGQLTYHLSSFASL